MSHRFMYSNLIDESAAIDALSAAAGFVGGAVPRVANGPGAAVFSGAYTGDDPEIYTVEIDTEGDAGAATFKWRKSTSSGWEASGITTALTDISLEAGVNVRFTSGTGTDFSLGDRWQATATRFRSPKRVIDLDPATKWRGDTPAADPEYLTFDLGATGAPDAVVVHGHNISSGATVKIQGGPVPQDYAVDLDGTSGTYVSVADDSSIKPSNEVTWEGWFRLDDLASGNQALMVKGNDTRLQWLSGSSLLAIENLNIGGTARSLNSSASPLTEGQWHHIAVTYDGDKIRIYIDGALDATSSSYVGALTWSASPLYLGSYNAASNFLDGAMKEVRIYDRDLSATEVGEHFAGVFTDETGLVAHWKFDEGTGTSAADSSTNTNTGTLTGAGATWTTEVYSPVDETITYQADTMLRYLTTATRSYRYWRLLITGDSGNADGWLEVAEVYLGAYFEPAYNYEFGNVLGEQSFEESRETESKAEKTVLLNRGRTASLPYRHMTATEKDSFLSMFRTVKDTAAERNKPLFAHLDVDDGESLIFAAIGGPFSPNEEGPDDFSFELELRERFV